VFWISGLSRWHCASSGSTASISNSTADLMSTVCVSRGSRKEGDTSLAMRGGL
jgi:hypothetical protein